VAVIGEWLMFCAVLISFFGLGCKFLDSGLSCTLTDHQKICCTQVLWGQAFENSPIPKKFGGENPNILPATVNRKHVPSKQLKLSTNK